MMMVMNMPKGDKYASIVVHRQGILFIINSAMDLKENSGCSHIVIFKDFSI